MNNEFFVERDCKITHEDQSFESGGAYLLPCRDGKIRGIVYHSDVKNVVTDWHGNVIARASYTDYRGNFCKMRRVSFSLKIEGQRVNFIGDYCPDWVELVKVRSTKPVRLEAQSEK